MASIIQKLGESKMEKIIEKFLSALDDIMKANGPYKDKIERIRYEASQADMSNLEELKSWLEEIFPDEE